MPRKREQSQTDRFIQKARELGCDEDEAAFDKRLRKIAKPSGPKARQAAKHPKDASER